MDDLNYAFAESLPMAAARGKDLGEMCKELLASGNFDPMQSGALHAIVQDMQSGGFQVVQLKETNSCESRHRWTCWFF